MAKCLVLGGNGLIGSSIVDRLAADGHTVRVFGTFKSEKTHYKSNKNIEQFVGNFLSEDSLKRSLKDMEYVFHFISTTTPITAENDPIIDIDTNIRMSVKLFQLCIDEGVKRVIYSSSGGAIYGPSSGTGVHHEDDPARPVSPYAIGKLTIENYLNYFWTKYGLDYTIFRISNPYGNHQSSKSKQGVIPIFLDRIQNNQEVTVYGDGTMIRDYVYVNDLADMIVKTFDKPSKRKTYNIGSGVGTSVNDIITCIEDVTGKKANIKYEDQPSTFIDKVILNTERFTTEFNVKPKTSLLDGIKATYENTVGDQ